MINAGQFLIKPIDINDLEPFYSMIDRNRERLKAFFPGTVSRTLTLEATRNFILENNQKRSEKTYFSFVVINTENQDFVGYLDLKNIVWDLPKAEMGFFMDEMYAHKGFTTQIFQAFCDYCMKEMGFIKLFLRTHESNTSACHLAQKCGFQLEGTIRNDHRTTDGAVVDLLYFGKIT